MKERSEYPEQDSERSKSNTERLSLSMSDTPNFTTLVPPANEWELKGMSVAIGALRISINSPAGGASCDSEARNQARRQAIMQLVAAAPKLLEALTDVAEWWAEEVAKNKAGKPSLFTVPMYGAPACIFTVNQVLAELKEGGK